MKSLLLFPFKLLGRFFSWFWRQSKRKKIVISLLLIIVSVILSRSFANGNGEEYLTETPKRETVTEIVTETGNITTSSRVDIFSTTNGIVEDVAVVNGGVVKVGDPLFSVRSSATQQEKDTARSNYLSAKSTLDGARATQLALQASMFDAWEQYKTLAEGDKYEDGDGKPKDDKRTLPEFVISQKEWQAAEATFKNQELKIAQAQAATSATWLAYQSTLDSEVKSPIAGTIYNLSIAETDAVAAKSATNLTPVLVVADLSRARIKVELNEVDIPKVAVGQNVVIEVDAIPGKTFTGKVEQVDTIGQNVSGVVTYNIYLSLVETDLQIKPGMTVSVDITVAKKENVLTVSSSAVKPHEGGRAVQVVDPETKKPKFIPVEVGLRGDGRTEIVSGIDENTQVITALKNDQVQRSNGGPFGQ